MRRNIVRCHPSEIANPGTAINLRIGVENLPPPSRPRQPDPIAVPRHRREIGGHDHRRILRFSISRESHHGLVAVIGHDPAEAFRLAVARMQSRLRLVKTVQVPDKELNPFMQRKLEQMEIEGAIFVPLAPLSELLSHEQKLLAGMRPHEAVIGTKVGKLLPVIARHFVDKRSLAVHHFIVAERQHEILGESIKQAEGEPVMVPFPVHGL